MAEPIGPEAYLAIASSVHSLVNNYRIKKRAEQTDKLTVVSTDSSKSSLTLPADELLSYSGLKVGNDGYVQWAMDNPAHPSNWSRKRKAYDFGLILFLEFFMNGISAAGTPASFDGLEVLVHGREVGLVAFTTMYLLGQALGVLLLSPYSDKFGRRMLYIGSAFLYSVFCLPVAATSNIAGIFVGRFITGVISAIPAVTTRLTIEDLFDTKGRMRAFFSWALVTNLGLALGPIYASYVSTSLNWRWPFYLATIIVAVTGLLTYFIRESHASHLLNRKVAAIQSFRVDLILQTTSASPRPSVSQPLILLSTNPLIFLSSLANAFSTALLYLFAVAFPIIFTHYAWTVQKTTLIFLFITLGLLFSTLTRLHDRHTPRKYPLTNDRVAPHSHLFGVAIGAPALAIALWWFAWTIPGTRTHNIAWPASAISLIAIGYGINEHSTVLPRHLLESNSQTSTHDAASAFTALLAARALLSAAFPLFTTRMFEKLGNNVAASVLAATATVFGLVPFILLKSAARRNEGSDNVSSNVTGEEESAHEVKNVEKAVKARKSVRWMDETDSRSDDPSITSSESASTSPSATISDPRLHDNQSAIQKPEAQSPAIVSRDFADAGGVTSAPETRFQNGSHDDTVAKLDARNREAERGAVSGTEIRVTGIANSEQEKKREENEKEEKPKDRTQVDDGDNGAVGFWGLGVDVERVAVFPYF